MHQRLQDSLAAAIEIVIELDGYETKREMLDLKPGSKTVVDANLSTSN